MKWIAVWLLLFLPAAPSPGAAASETPYRGTWQTTNRKLDGSMTCVVTDLGGEKWRGRFHGVWQGVPFDYVVDFTGPPSALRGSARIDGADYSWTGELAAESFRGKFGGTRYVGHFDLKKPAAGFGAER
jgi:hypothetical protein